jgi:hypothetical protein
MTYDELVKEVISELRDSGINPESAVVKNLLLKVYEEGECSSRGSYIDQGLDDLDD